MSKRRFRKRVGTATSIVDAVEAAKSADKKLREALFDVTGDLRDLRPLFGENFGRKY
jgi:hypothetical protein